jgi:hypothetical protein
MEVYFDILDNKNVVELCRFRTANNKLPIEIERWNNINLLSLINSDFFLEENSNLYFKTFGLLWYIDISILFKEWTI